MGNYTVYAHIFPNNKVYVGITRQTTQKRWCKGKGYGRTQRMMQNAIKKYGWENVRHIVLHESLLKEDACELEKHYIQDLHLYEYKYGYNASMGGDINVPSPSTRKKIAESARERWTDEAYRERAMKSMKGKQRSEESKAHISKAQKKRFENPEQRYLAGSSSRGKHRSEQAKADTSRSLKLFYANPVNAENHRQEMRKRNQMHCKQIRCVETQKVYKSVHEASAELKKSHQNLSACLHGKRKTFGGYHWEFI